MTMTEIVLYQNTMTAAEARAKTDAIRLHLDQAGHHTFEARKEALDLKRREGWKALGYSSFAACSKAEFGKSYQYLYKLIRAEEIAESFALFSPMGETPHLIELHARELNKLPTPEAQHEAYERAQSLATAEQTNLEFRHVQQAVQITQAEQIANRNPVIARMVAAEEITALTGAALARKCQQYTPAIQQRLFELMTLYGLRNPALLDAFADMLARVGTLNPSRVLQEVLTTGCLGGVPLKDATYANLERAKAESQAARISEEQAVKRQLALEAGNIVPEPVITTLWKYDAKRTLKELRRALGDSEFERLRDAMLGE
jgi:hypothetical protein